MVAQICQDGFHLLSPIKVECCEPPTLQPAEMREATLARISPSRGGQHPMGCPFGYVKKFQYTLDLLINCITFSAVFWDVRAFILPNIIIDNGILEATSIKGWFKLDRPFLF